MEFITDRTYGDVQKVKDYNKAGWNELSEEEKKEWLAGMKGAFNYTDMNRINEALNFIELRCAIKDTVYIPYSITNNFISANTYDYLYFCGVEKGYLLSGKIGSETFNVVPDEFKKIQVTGKDVTFSFYTDDGSEPQVRPYCYIGGSVKEFPFGEGALKTDYKMEDYLTYSDFKKTIDKYNELRLRCNVIQNDLMTITKKPNFQFFNQLEELLKRGYEFLEQHISYNPFSSDDFIYPIEWEDGYSLDSSGVIEQTGYSLSKPIPLNYDTLNIFLNQNVGSVSLIIAFCIYSSEEKKYVLSNKALTYPVIDITDVNSIKLVETTGREAVRIAVMTSKAEAISVQCKVF